MSFQKSICPKVHLWTTRPSVEYVKHLSSGGKRETFTGYPMFKIWDGQEWVAAKWNNQRQEWMPAGMNDEEWGRLVG